MDTFFFIHIDIVETGEILRFGPYGTMSAAAEIMMDCLPNVLNAELARETAPRYIATISEWILSNNTWEKIATKAVEDRRR